MTYIWKNASVLKLIEENNNNDPIVTIREKARELALRGFSYGWDGPPYNPIELARFIDIPISPNEEIFDSRIIPIAKNKFEIEYNPFQRITRTNFSIAHEIGHTLFSDCDQTIRNREKTPNSNNWELEFLCNVAASEILMPISSFSQESESLNLGLESIIDLAEKFNASVESVLLRFTEVTEKPITVAICEFNQELNNLKILYSKSSRVANLSLDFIDDLPSESNAYDCLNPGWTAKELSQWEIFRNTKYHVHSIGLPPLKRGTTNRVGLLIFPEFFNNPSEDMVPTVFGDATQPRGSGNKIIVQILNTFGALGFGFGKSMSSKWPKSKESVKEWKNNKESFQLGNSRIIQLADDVYVFQIIAQKGIKPSQGQIPLRYDALSKGLKQLSIVARDLNASVHMPKIGAGQAKGDWTIIEGLIRDILINKGISITVYIMPGTRIQNRPKKHLTLFDD